MKKAMLCSLLLTALASTHANAGNYAECLLDKLPGASNQVVTTATVRICSKKYPAMFYGVEYGAGLSIFGFGYSNPDECTADKAKNTQSHSAAALIRSACMRLYTKEEPVDLSTAKPWDEFKPEAEPIKVKSVETPTAEELAKAIAADADKESKAERSKDDSLISMRAFAQGGDVIIEGILNTGGDLDEHIAASLKEIAVPDLMLESCSALGKKGISGSGLRFIYRYFNRNGVLVYSKTIGERECRAYESTRISQENRIDLASAVLDEDQSSNTVQAHSVADQTTAHYNAIYAAHPDADNIVKSSEFKAWISSLSDEWRREYDRVLSEGSTEQVIAMLGSYKNSGYAATRSKQSKAVSNQAAQYQEPQINNCVFKGVMTQADYDACGITPP